ncbi:Na+/H+ antiporter subunit E [Mobilitalea sibirica]|nr:Na+/H+ antiporter subunit E [Mobilitalea sibirica]
MGIKSVNSGTFWSCLNLSVCFFYKYEMIYLLGDFMKKMLKHIPLVIIFTVIWIILNEGYKTMQILTGIGVSIITIIFTNRFLLLEGYKETYKVSPIVLIKYFFVLFVQIYKSGISSINKIIRGEGKVGISEHKTVIDDELRICMLANAITSTPGTVTLDKKGQELTILSLGRMDDSVLKIFERILKETKE